MLCRGVVCCEGVCGQEVVVFGSTACGSWYWCVCVVVCKSWPVPGTTAHKQHLQHWHPHQLQWSWRLWPMVFVADISRGGAVDVVFGFGMVHVIFVDCVL